VLYGSLNVTVENILDTVRQDAAATSVVLMDELGTLLASSGDLQALDVESLSTLVLGNSSAAPGIANLVGEREFSILLEHERLRNIHIALVRRTYLLIVSFRERSSLAVCENIPSARSRN
jgi:hypothetical protein